MGGTLPVLARPLDGERARVNVDGAGLTDRIQLRRERLADIDKYNGDASLVDRIAFLPSGGIAPPEDTANSALPTTSGGRGIYFADFFGKNYFRVTVDSDLSGHLRVDKLVPGTGYTATGWVWR